MMLGVSAGVFFLVKVMLVKRRGGHRGEFTLQKSGLSFLWSAALSSVCLV